MSDMTCFFLTQYMQNSKDYVRRIHDDDLDDDEDLLEPLNGNGETSNHMFKVWLFYCYIDIYILMNLHNLRVKSYVLD